MLSVATGCDLRPRQHRRRTRSRDLGDYLRHLSIANGSLMELETEFEAARRLGLLSETEFTLVAKRCGEVGRLLAGLIRSLKRLWNVRRPTPGTRHPTPSNR